MHLARDSRDETTSFSRLRAELSYRDPRSAGFAGIIDLEKAFSLRLTLQARPRTWSLRQTASLPPVLRTVELVRNLRRQLSDSKLSIQLCSGSRFMPSNAYSRCITDMFEVR